MDFDGKKILVDVCAEQLAGKPQYDYIATDLEVCGYDCDLYKFVGPYRSESNPTVLDTGLCTNSPMWSNNCIGVLCSEMTLQAGETKNFNYTLGATDNKEDVDEQIDDALDTLNCEYGFAINSDPVTGEYKGDYIIEYSASW